MALGACCTAGSQAASLGNQDSPLAKADQLDPATSGRIPPDVFNIATENDPSGWS
ncbi:MAG: hypothetical protein LBJ62_03290 [Bifidobacteriaceae bacterium]|nr:hypothetical protein [Bifidobacteriaceae bacterium]